MFEMRFPDWASPGGKNHLREPFEREQQHATFARGQKLPYSRHAPRQRSENLSKDQFGVLAKGTLRKLYSRIEAPWPELIEGIRPLVHQVLNERRELHKSLSKPHICSRFIVYTKPLRRAQGGLQKKLIKVIPGRSVVPDTKPETNNANQQRRPNEAKNSLEHPHLHPLVPTFS